MFSIVRVGSINCRLLSPVHLNLVLGDVRTDEHALSVEVDDYIRFPELEALVATGGGDGLSVAKEVLTAVFTKVEPLALGTAVRKLVEALYPLRVEEARSEPGAQY